MLAIATFYEIWQMDVKTAFLDGFFREELYMMQPEGFDNPKGTTRCASSNARFMGWCKHLGVGTFVLMR